MMSVEGPGETLQKKGVPSCRMARSWEIRFVFTAQQCGSSRIRFVPGAALSSILLLLAFCIS